MRKEENVITKLLKMTFQENPAQETETQQLENCGGAKFIATGLMIVLKIHSIKYCLKSGNR